jgi:hypothetical protein
MKTRQQILRTALLIVALLTTAHADDKRRAEKREHHNYILERQESYQAQGVPTSRIIVGKREIDGYTQRDGSKVWFERDNVVGVSH